MKTPAEATTKSSARAEFFTFIITLISFTAVSESDHVLLEWTTASEENNSFYRVERSENGMDFEFIGFIDGGGTTDATNYYTFKDEDSINGANYYRLVDIDFKENENLSEVIRVLYTREVIIPRPYPSPTKAGAGIY